MTRKTLIALFENQFYEQFDFEQDFQFMLISFFRNVINDIPEYEFDPDGKRVERLTPETLLEHICKICGVDIKAVKGKRRGRELVTVRHLFAYFSKIIFGKKYSLKYLGEVLGDRDHTTIIHSFNAARDYIKNSDPLFIDAYQMVYPKIKMLTAV